MIASRPTAPDADRPTAIGTAARGELTTKITAARRSGSSCDTARPKPVTLQRYLSRARGWSDGLIDRRFLSEPDAGRSDRLGHVFDVIVGTQLILKSPHKGLTCLDELLRGSG